MGVDVINALLLDLKPTFRHIGAALTIWMVLLGAPIKNTFISLRLLQDAEASTEFPQGPVLLFK